MLRDRILFLCKEKGINVSTLENTLGLAKSTISKWDKSSPKADNLKKVADYFGVTIDYLMSEDIPHPRFDDSKVATPEEIALKEQEIKIRKKLEDLYNGMNEEDKKTAIAVLEAIAAKGKK